MLLVLSYIMRRQFTNQTDMPLTQTLSISLEKYF